MTEPLLTHSKGFSLTSILASVPNQFHDPAFLLQNCPSMTKTNQDSNSLCLWEKKHCFLPSAQIRKKIFQKEAIEE